jgi:hypothetical protein
MEWQPIDTARVMPFDGKGLGKFSDDVLLWSDGMVHVGYYAYTPKGKAMWKRSVSPVTLVQPTHWMPLPEPPKT